MKNTHLLATIGTGLIFTYVAGCQAQPPVPEPQVGRSLVPQVSAQPGGIDKDAIVQAKLVADTTAIKPGTTFTVGIVYTMQPEWHIYWKNPGASGFATTVEWGLPPGASSSDTLYPAPLSFESPGNIVSFGYEKETMLMAEARAADLPENGNVQITAKTRWLMCSDRCIPHSKNDLTLTLPVGEGKPANQELFSKYRKQVPEPAAELPANVKSKVEAAGSASTFSLTVTPAKDKKLVAEAHDGLHAVYFYPNDKADADYVVEPPTVEGKTATAGDSKVYEGPATIKWTAEPSKNAAEPYRRIVGTLVYQTVSGSTPDEPVLLEIDQKL